MSGGGRRVQVERARAAQMHGDVDVLLDNAVDGERLVGVLVNVAHAVVALEDGGRAELGGGHTAAAADPRVPQHIAGRVAHGDVVLEQVADEVLGVVGDARPVVARELVDALLDALEQQLLTLGALLAALPAAVAAALARERTLARQHDVHNHAQAPQVAPLVVRHVVDERLDHLGRQVLGRAHWCAQLGRGHWSCRPTINLDLVFL